MFSVSSMVALVASSGCTLVPFSASSLLSSLWLRWRPCTVALLALVPFLTQLQGSHYRRTISLGLGVCPQVIPEVPLLHRRLALRTGLASRQHGHCFPQLAANPRSYNPEQPRLRPKTVASHASRHRARHILPTVQHFPSPQAASR